MAADGFSAESAARALAVAGAETGLNVAGAELLRLGENAIYRLRSVPLVARIARTIEYLPDVETEVAAARWLESEQFPAVRLAGPAVQPVVADGRVVTFWELLGERTMFGTVGELAVLLRRLHALVPPSSLALPLLRPFARVEGRINGSDLAEHDRAFLRARLVELRARYERLMFSLQFGPVHGDANIGNILRRESDGVAVLTDLDGFSFGPREWDLVLTAMYFERFGWHTEREYREFADTYGFDVRAWPGYPVLREVRELTMTTWIMQNIGESAAIAAEFALRVQSLRERDFARAWHFF